MIIYQLVKEIFLILVIGWFAFWILLIVGCLLLWGFWGLIKLSGYKEEDNIIPGYDEYGEIIN